MKIIIIKTYFVDGHWTHFYIKMWKSTSMGLLCCVSQNIFLIFLEFPFSQFGNLRVLPLTYWNYLNFPAFWFSIIRWNQSGPSKHQDLVPWQTTRLDKAKHLTKQTTNETTPNHPNHPNLPQARPAKPTLAPIDTKKAANSSFEVSQE